MLTLYDQDHSTHLKPCAYIAGVDGAVERDGRTGYGVVLVTEDGTKKASYGESETYPNAVAVLISGILKALSMAQKQNISHIGLVLDEHNILQWESFNFSKEVYQTGVLRRKLSESPVNFTVKEYDSYKYCETCDPNHQFAWRLARIGSGTHSKSPNPINDNLYKNGVIGVAISAITEDAADNMVLGAYGYHYDDRLAGLDGIYINDGHANLMPRDPFKLYIDALKKALWETNWRLNHDEVRIKTDLSAICFLIDTYKSNGLRDFLDREDFQDLKETLEMFAKIEIEYTPNRRTENILDAYSLAHSELERKKKSTYWKNGIRRVYTDGSCENNGDDEQAIAGCGVFWGPCHRRNASFPIPGRQTNNRAEYLAVIQALETAIDNQISRLIICVDTQLLIDSIGRYMPKWKRKGWKTNKGRPVKNQDLLERIDELMGKMEFVRFEKVLGHSGHVGNEGADRLAREAVEKAKESAKSK